MKQLIFNNKYLTYHNESLYNEICIKNNIMFVNDLYDGNDFISLEEFTRKIGMYPARHLDYNLLKLVITQNKSQAYNPTEIKYLFRGKEIGKLKRKGMLQLIAEFEPSHATIFWNNKFNYQVPKDMWSIPFKCTKETRLQTLQWKIMGIASNRNCTRCGQVDYIEQFFAECPAVRPLWTEAENLMAIWLGRRHFYDLYGSRTRKIVPKRIQNYRNLAILIGKLRISKFKYKKQTFLKGLFYSETHLRKSF